METTLGLTTRRLSSAIGAVIDGADLTRPLPPQVVRILDRALLDHGVIFFQDQDRIDELGAAESAHVLALLFQHLKSQNFVIRWRWTPNDVALWDNRAVQHYSVPDYEGERVMQRVVLAGDRPAGPT